MLVGFGVAAHYKGDQAFLGPDMSITHQKIGVVVCALGFLQPLNAVLRPHPHAEPDPKRRPWNDRRTLWEWVHKPIGYVALLLGVVNIAIAAYMVSPEGDLPYEESLYMGTSLFLGLVTGPIVLFAVLKSLMNTMAKPKDAKV